MSKAWNRDAQPRKPFQGKRKKPGMFVEEGQIEADRLAAAEWRAKNPNRPKLPAMYVRDYRWLPFEDIADSLVEDK